MSGTIIHNPEDPLGGLVGRLAHDLSNKAIHGSNAVLDFAAAEGLGAMHIPRCQVGPSAFAKVLVLDSHGARGSRRQSRLFAASGLNTGLFIRRDHEVVGAQRGVADIRQHVITQGLVAEISGATLWRLAQQRCAAPVATSKLAFPARSRLCCQGRPRH